jgi:hypothetical protein
LYGTGPGLVHGRSRLEECRAEEPPINVQALEGERVEVPRYRKPLARLVFYQRRPRSRAEQAIDRTWVIAEIAKRALSLANEWLPRSASPHRSGAVVVAAHDDPGLRSEDLEGSRLLDLVAEERRRTAMTIRSRFESDRAGRATARSAFETSEAVNARLHSTSTAIAELAEPGVVCDPHRAPPR